MAQAGALLLTLTLAEQAPHLCLIPVCYVLGGHTALRLPLSVCRYGPVHPPPPCQQHTHPGEAAMAAHAVSWLGWQGAEAHLEQAVDGGGGVLRHPVHLIPEERFVVQLSGALPSEEPQPYHHDSTRPGKIPLWAADRTLCV